MSAKGRGARSKIAAALAARQITRVGEPEWAALRDEMPEVSEATLRRHLLELGAALDQPWRGVDTQSLDGLERTLRDLTVEYARQPELVRELVIAAKDRARFAARNAKVAAEKRALKNEMAEWMLVWLGDPRMFADWVSLRRAILSNRTEN